MAGLIIFDLSAAFEIIDNLIVLKHIEFSFSTKERALTWVKSYITDRTQSISVDDKTSPDVSLHFDVPQGFDLE